MPTPLSPTKLFVCSGCGAALPVEAEQVGRKCRCGRCGKIVTVPGHPVDESEPAQESPQRVSFSCRVCDTRLTALAADQGKKAKCPDCGTLTVVPPPPEARPPEVPGAMHGRQYGLWDVDGAPSPADLAAQQPKFFPVYCTVCDTLMYATARQVGAKLTCPDCGAKTVVKRPPVERPVESALVPDGEEYQLDQAAVPGPRPVPAALKKLEAEQEQEKTSDGKGKKTEKPSPHQRPKCPKAPLLQGVWPMLWRSPLGAWWGGLSLVMAMELWLILNAVSGGWGSGGWGKEQAIVLVSYAASLVLGLLWLIAASAIWLAVLTESSEGNDRLHHPPGAVFLDWTGDFLYVVTAGMAGLAPWWVVSRFLGNLPLEQRGGLLAGGWLLCFPVLLLSSLESGSPVGFFSVRLFSSLVRRPGQWLLFYLETALLAGGCVLAAVAMSTLSPWLSLLAIPLGVAASLLYFRLLGRLAWWLAESLPMVDEN